MMGVSDRWGTVEPGKLADVIAVKGDLPCDINLLSRVDLVVTGGIVYKQNGQPVEENL